MTLSIKQPALAAADSWLEGTNYTARFVVFQRGSTTPEDLSGWPELEIGVQGEGVSGPNTTLAAVLYDAANGGAASGAIKVSLLQPALLLGRSGPVSQILYTVKARRFSWEERILANVYVAILDSAFV